jgi:hypothetical protein
MAKFIVVHQLPGAATQDEAIAAGKAIVTASPNGSGWLKGWVVPDSNRLLCEWEVPEEDAIRAALGEVDLFPVEAIYPVTAIDPAWFAE